MSIAVYISGSRLFDVPVVIGVEATADGAITFGDIDIEAKADEVCEKFLNKKLAEEIFNFPSSFGGYQRLDTKSFFN